LSLRQSSILLPLDLRERRVISMCCISLWRYFWFPIFSAPYSRRIACGSEIYWQWNYRHTFRQNFISTYLNLDVGYFDNIAGWQSVNKLYRGFLVSQTFIQMRQTIFCRFPNSHHYLAYYFYSPLVAILLAALFPIYILITHRSSMAWGVARNRKNEIADISQGRAQESLAGIRVVKAFLGEVFEFRMFQRARDQIEKINNQQTKSGMSTIFTAVSPSISFYFLSCRISCLWRTAKCSHLVRWRFCYSSLTRRDFAVCDVVYHRADPAADAGSKDFFDVLENQTAHYRISRKHLSSCGRRNRHAAAKAFRIRMCRLRMTTTCDIWKTYRFHFLWWKLASVGESGQGKSNPRQSHTSLLRAAYRGTIRNRGKKYCPCHGRIPSETYFHRISGCIVIFRNDRGQYSLWQPGCDTRRN